MKDCRRCLETKPVSEFAKNLRNRDGLHSYCTKCRREYAREKYHERKSSISPEQNRANARKYRYGITQEQYEDMLSSQGNACAVCQVRFGEDAKPNIDHDHNCCPGKVTCGFCVRGVLCGACVSLAVKVETRMNTFTDMFNYLREHLDLRVERIQAATQVGVKESEVN